MGPGPPLHRGITRQQRLPRGRCERTKLKPGNTFQSAFFATGSPLILSNLVQDDTFATLYEIGRKSGVTQLTVETAK